MLGRPFLGGHLSARPTAPSALLYASQVGAHYCVDICALRYKTQLWEACHSWPVALVKWNICVARGVSRSPITSPVSLPPAKSRFPPSLFSAPRHCPRERHQKRQNIRRCRENNLAMMENGTTEWVRLTAEANKAAAVTSTQRQKKIALQKGKRCSFKMINYPCLSLSDDEGRKKDFRAPVAHAKRE